jgi:hypothetical protein
VLVRRWRPFIDDYWTRVADDYNQVVSKRPVDQNFAALLFAHPWMFDVGLDT